MSVETFSFDKGINRKKSKILLTEGENYSVSGFSFNRDGILTARTAKTETKVIDGLATSRINGIHRWQNSIYASSKALCPGNQSRFNYIYQRLLTGAYSQRNIFLGNSRPRWADYENFVFAVDGESKRAYIDEKSYAWGIANPELPPAVAASASAGNPNGSYECYFTYYVKFPNDKVVETGPSPSATVAPSSKKISWSGLIPCGYQGTDLTIEKRLYREISGEIYLVSSVSNNTMTYEDDVSDSALQSASELVTESYTVPPAHPVDIAVYLQRVFVIWENKLGWSEAYEPFSFLDTSDITVTKENENLVTVTDWGDQLYMASVPRWYRLQGTDPDTWAIKRTFADYGIINRHTMERSKWGILGLWFDGICNFDGVVSKNISDKKLGKSFFNDIYDLDLCYSEFDGVRYYFYYPLDSSTYGCIVLDFTYAPDFRIYEDNFIADAHEFYPEAGMNYYAKHGWEYADGGTETIPTSIITGEKVYGNRYKRKCPRWLYYDMNTNNKDVIVNLIGDGENLQTLTINTSERTTKRSDQLTDREAYSLGLEISCPDSQNIEIYAPWGLEADLVGE